MQFFTTAVVVLGTNNKVTGIVAVNNGTFGMLVNGSGNILEGNTLAGNGGSGGIGPNGQAQGAQLAISGNANQLLRNELATQQSENDVTNIAIDGDRNILEENNTSGGDPAEVVIFTVHTGNVLRRNSILGGIFSHTTPILDNNAPGSNTYESNLCFFPSVGPSPAPCPGFPGLSGHMNATSTPLSPSQQISNLIALLNSFHVGPSGQSLLNKLLDIQDKIMKGRLGSVCNDLAAFIREVMAQSGKSLTAAQANQLIAAVNQLGTTLGC
ncbi:MAG TPA: hypothetical protein VEU96_27680 [Bryobacteraceae bacterium]|nr:hypothetical protein [Bryobacteraceae bacterium]